MDGVGVDVDADWFEGRKLLALANAGFGGEGVGDAGVNPPKLGLGATGGVGVDDVDPCDVMTGGPGGFGGTVLVCDGCDEIGRGGSGATSGLGAGAGAEAGVGCDGLFLAAKTADKSGRLGAELVVLIVLEDIG